MRIAAATIVVAVIVIYAIYRSLPYVSGPSIKVFQPLSGSTIASTTMTLIGRADRVSSLTMNGNPIQVDESGNFKETLIVFPGVNIISFDATDRFKRNAHLEIEILGTQTLPEGRVGTSTRTKR